MYGKIFQQIYDGSLRSDPMVRLVFMDMVILADQDGVVDMTHEAIAARTNVPIKTIYGAIEQLENPDPRSRSPREDGARIKRLDDHRDWGRRPGGEGAEGQAHLRPPTQPDGEPSHHRRDAPWNTRNRRARSQGSHRRCGRRRRLHPLERRPVWPRHPRREHLQTPRSRPDLWPLRRLNPPLLRTT